MPPSRADDRTPRPPRPLPLAQSPYRLPRTAGSGRVTAPTLPFSDPESVLAALGAVGSVTSGRAPHEIAVECPTTRLGTLGRVLEDVGTAGLAVCVRIPTVPAAADGPSVVRALAAARVVSLDVLEPVAVSGVTATDWIETAKACLSFGVPLRWSGTVDPDLAAETAHLVPARAAAEWRRGWRYGALVWRRGPGFLLVSDARDPGARKSHTIDLAALSDAFGPDLDRPAERTADAKALIEELAGAGLVAQLPVGTSWLPYRLRRPPISLD